MSLLPSTAMANNSTTYYVAPQIVSQLEELLVQMRQQIATIERYLRALDQAIALEPLPGEMSAPAAPS